MKTLFEYPASRRTDPLSSYIAEDRVINSGRRGRQALMVYEALRKNDGSTSRELEAAMGLPEVAHRRLPDLEKAGLIKRGKMRKCRICKQLCLTWEIEK